MRRDEAEDFIYASYMAAAPQLSFDAPDSEKRHPELTRDLLRSLAHADTAIVTGSKGKGSAARMAAALVQTERRVGLMTSPHIRRFNERFCVDGVPISDSELAEAVTAVAPAIEKIEGRLLPGEFVSPIGIECAAALAWFRTQGTEADILECGKGARFDDVTNVPHRFCAINTIFLEHTRELGPTVLAIAADKAYAIQPECEAAFIGPQEEEAMVQIAQRACALGVPLLEYGRDFEATDIRWGKAGIICTLKNQSQVLEDVELALLGEFQARNAALALALAEALLGHELAGRKVREALDRLRIPGRMELVSKEPLLVVDACINRASAEEAREALAHLGCGPGLIAIVGIPDDKDYAGVVHEMAGVADEIWLTASQNPHYVFTERQERCLAAEGMKTRFVPTVAGALSEARATGRPVCLLGTTSVIAEAEAVLAQD